MSGLIERLGGKIWEPWPLAIVLIRKKTGCDEAEAVSTLRALVHDKRVNVRSGPHSFESVLDLVYRHSSFKNAEELQIAARNRLEVNMHELRAALAILSEPSAGHKSSNAASRRPGAPPRVTNRVKSEMREMEWADLDAMTEKGMKEQFRAARTICRNARNAIRAELER
jgi:hypothetical protein